ESVSCIPELPQALSLQGPDGKWYADNQKVCKGNPGETEGLLTFRRGHFIGLENDCTIRDSKVRGRSILVKMICEGEGMRELSSEILEVLNERQVMRTVWNQGKRYSFEITRCP